MQHTPEQHNTTPRLTPEERQHLSERDKNTGAVSGVIIAIIVFAIIGLLYFIYVSIGRNNETVALQTLPTDQNGGLETAATNTALDGEAIEGKPFAVIDGVVQAIINEQLYIVGAQSNNALVLTFVSSTDTQFSAADDTPVEQRTLTTGSLISLAGKVHALPTPAMMQQLWQIDAIQAASLSEDLEWYVSATHIMERTSTST